MAAVVGAAGMTVVQWRFGRRARGAWDVGRVEMPDVVECFLGAAGLATVVLGSRKGEPVRDRLGV